MTAGDDQAIATGGSQPPGRAAARAAPSPETATSAASPAPAEGPALFEGILEAAAAGIATVGPDGRIVLANAAASALLGYRRHELVGRPIGELHSPHQPDGRTYDWAGCPIHHTLRDGRLRHTPGALVTREDGSSLAIEYACSPLSDPDGGIRGAVVCFGEAGPRDRSVHLELAKRVKELRCLYRVLELTAATGPASLEEVGRGVADALPPTMLHANVAVAEVSIGGVSCRSESWTTPVAALRREVRVGASTVGFVEVGYREARDDLEWGHGPFLAEEVSLLDGVATHLRRMLEHRRLVEALARRERLDAIGRLTGGLAHDFNNLLAVVQGSAELLLVGVDPASEAGALVTTIVDAARSGSELTQRLLAFARRQALAPRVVELDALVAGIEPLLRRTLGPGIELVVTRGDEVGPVVVDPAQFDSALLNLCINARDAMPRGGRLRLTTRRVQVPPDAPEVAAGLEPGGYVELEVADTGEGIAAEHLPRVFEPFFTTKHHDRGTGLGLSTVHGFAEQSRGHVGVASTPGVGTTVRLLLPAAR